MISKADTEIEELEKDLVILQSELAWAENREWSEICSTSLREKINCLDISIQSLKNENERDINVHLLMRREPAERIHEIIKVLLRRYCLENDEQVCLLEHSHYNFLKNELWFESYIFYAMPCKQVIIERELEEEKEP